jgi:membrane dipeptidase
LTGARTLLIALAVISLFLTAQAQTPYLQEARALLKRVPLIDGHNDTPWQYRKRVNCDLNRIDLHSNTARLWPPMHTDIPRLQQGGMGAQFWSVYLPTDQPNTVAAFHNQVNLTLRMIKRYPELELATTADQIEELHSDGKIASLMGVEGGHALRGSLAELRWLYQQGVRYMTLTHTRSNELADSSGGPVWHGGLSDKGRLAVEEMNRLGMLIDVSHTSDATAGQVLDISTRPVVFTHSNARSLINEDRNVPDGLLDKLKKNDGVIMLSFVPSFVHDGPGPATLQHVADHFDYVKQRIGARHIGVGADFDGISKGPGGLEDVSRYPFLFAELMRRGWTEKELEMVAGGNLLRVMRANES